MKPEETGRKGVPALRDSLMNRSVSRSVISPLGTHSDESDEPTSESEAQLAVIVSELTDMMQRGQPIDIHSVCAMHPEHASDLMFLWGTVLVTDAVGGAEAKLIEESATKSDSVQDRKSVV